MTDRYPHRLSGVVDMIERRLGDASDEARAGRQSPSRVAPSRLSERPSLSRRFWIEPEVTWGEIAFTVFAILATWTFVFALDAGWFK